MTRLRLHSEPHLVSRIGWLPAAVLGANDGIVSTASLIVGVAAAAVKPADILVAGAAGPVADAMQMAAGEYVSVSSQSDTERADLERERKELAGNVDAEVNELAGIYVKRGVDPAIAHTVATDETGIAEYRDSAREVVRHLHGHGFEAEAHALLENGRSDADTLEGFSLCQGAELLGIVAFGHSHLREVAFGRVTRLLIQRPRLPLSLAR
ncbi:hypothetical protein BH10PSE15_BH10PSE15_08720 [soil metagenome]